MTFPQAVEAIRIRPAEAVNGLIWVADDEQAALPPVFHQPVLQGVDVLKLVYQQMGESGRSSRSFLQCAQQQIIQVSQAVHL